MAIPMPKPRGGASDDVRSQGGNKGGGAPRFSQPVAAPARRGSVDQTAAKSMTPAEEKAAEESPGLHDSWVFWENRELPRGSARERAGDSYHHTLGFVSRPLCACSSRHRSPGLSAVGVPLNHTGREGRWRVGVGFRRPKREATNSPER